MRYRIFWSKSLTLRLSVSPRWVIDDTIKALKTDCFPNFHFVINPVFGVFLFRQVVIVNLNRDHAGLSLTRGLLRIEFDDGLGARILQ